MKRIAIAVHAFIHNHVDVSAGEAVTGLSEAALSDLEKNGLVRFEDREESADTGTGGDVNGGRPALSPKAALAVAKAVAKAAKQSVDAAVNAAGAEGQAAPAAGQADASDAQATGNDAASGAQGE